MRKVKFATKSEKSVNAFFEDENPEENTALIFANVAEVLKPEEVEEDKNFIGKHKPLINILKQLFLFLPGTLFLYFVSFVAAIIFMDIFFHRRPLATLPPSAPYQVILLAILGLLGIFMTWFGLGDIKNRKYLAIPASILVMGAIFGVILKATEKISDLAVRMLEEFNHYFIYLFPLILVVAVLAKSIVDRKTEDV